MVAPETLIRIPALPEEYTPLVFCAYTTILALHTHTSLPPTVGKRSFSMAFSQHHHESPPLVLFEHAYFIHRSDLRTVYYFPYRAQHWSQGVLWDSSGNQPVSVDLTPPTLRGWNSFVLSGSLFCLESSSFEKSFAGQVPHSWCVSRKSTVRI